MAETSIPRRSDVLQWTTAEKAIQDAVDIVEEIGADVRLTDAVILLGAARGRVADFIDGVKGDVHMVVTEEPEVQAGVSRPDPSAPLRREMNEKPKPCPKCGGPTAWDDYELQDQLVCLRSDELVEDCPGERRKIPDRRAPQESYHGDAVREKLIAAWMDGAMCSDTTVDEEKTAERCADRLLGLEGA